MTASTLLTELEAVNMMLAAVGQGQLAALTGTLPKDALTAQMLLEQKSRAVQSEGWYWNTERGLEIALDEDDKIPLPADTLRADAYLEGYPAGHGINPQVCQRGAFLYDLTNRTFIFEDSVVVQVVKHLAWDDLPPAARWYIACSAATDFEATQLGDPGVGAGLRLREAQARTALQTEESRVGEFAADQSLAVLRITGRSRPSYSWY